MPKRSFLRLLAPLLVMPLAACSVQRAHTVPFTGGDNKGLVYSVPKTYVVLTLTYTYLLDESGDIAPQRVAHLAPVQVSPTQSPVSPVGVATVANPDPDATFLVKTDELMSNLLFLSSVSFQFQKGTLTAVDASSVDRTGEIIEELGTTAVNISKALAKGGNNNISPREKAIMALEHRINQLHAAIATAAVEPDASKPVSPKITALKSELATLRSDVTELRSELDPPIEAITQTYKVTLDPDQPTSTTNDYMEYKIAPRRLFADVQPADMDTVFVRIYDMNRRQFMGALHGSNQPRDVPGILYRQPVLLLTKVLISETGKVETANEIFSDYVGYLQFTPPAVAALTSKVLTAKHTTVVMDPATGGLISYGIAQDSAVARAAQAAQESSAAAADASEKADKSQTSKSKSGTSSKTSGTSGTSGSSGSSGGSGKTVTPKSMTEVPAIETTDPTPAP